MEDKMINKRLINRTCVILSVMVIAIGCMTMTANAQTPPPQFGMWVQEFFQRGAQWPAIMQKPGMQVIMVGTGVPLYSPDRRKASVAIIAGGKFLLFDTGNDSTRTMEELNLPINLVDTIFLTHYHGDHVADLGSFINQTWIGGRQNKINVYGPPGARLQVAGFSLAGLLDKYIWKYSDQPLDLDLATAKGHDFRIPEDGSSAVVWSAQDPAGNDIVVKAFQSVHTTKENTCGYRVEYLGRSVVISGDTREVVSTDNYQDADLLIHESVNMGMIEGMATAAEGTGTPQGAAAAFGLRTAAADHTATLDIAAAASEAEVGAVVLTHILPPIPAEPLFEAMFVAGMAPTFGGPVFVSQDKDCYYLPPFTGVIEGPCDGLCQ
jgi:ribonuclease Z